MNLLRAAATVGGMTLISRVLGFVRDTIVARVFGAGAATDAFFVAFKIPNLLRRLFAEGAFSQAFVPILAEYKNRRGLDETRTLIDHVTGLLALALVVVAVIGVLAAPVVVYISAPGFVASPDKFDTTVLLLRIIFPYIFFISLVALAAGILNTFGRFSVPAFTPTLLNLSFIVGALFGAPYFDPPILALAWAVVIGGVIQLAFQLPFLWRLRLLPRPRVSLRHPGVGRIFKLMGPAVLGVSVAQISLIINTIFASFLENGSVSWLYYADRLMEFPTGLLGVALGTILLPSLAKHYADESPEEYSRLLDWGLRLTLLLALPAAVALAALSLPLTTTLFGYGKFSDHDALMTQQALIAYSIGLLGLSLVKVLAPGFYARQNIRTPVKIAIFTLVATQIMNLIFIGPLRHAGLALAIGLGACINAGLLFYQLRKHDIYRPQPKWVGFGLRVVIAAALMGAALVFGASYTDWLRADGATRAVSLSVLVVSGGVIYLAVLLASGIRLREFSRRAAE